MEKILVTGANGMVAQALIKLLLQQGYTVIATGRGPSRLNMTDPSLHYYPADLTHPFELQMVMEKELPQVVVHLAAMTQVDECALRQNEAHVMNVEATARLLLDAESFSSFFILLSTDFVFDGEKGMYIETDEPAPISWYGHTKVEAEALVETAAMDWAIIRTCLVYGAATPGGRQNIFSWVRSSLEAGKPINVVDDQWRTPTAVEDLAAGILLVIRQRAKGLWHLSGEERMTPYRMALAIAAQGGFDGQLLTRVTADSFTQPGKRPLLTGFDISKAKKELGFQPGKFADHIKKMTTEDGQ
ncbi:SDR family oxidoreductase [Flavihumibacter petaseus]|uniref:dTDP-4-dehydrorhamnose reductase n=1 Tax=Flavihumibacter petaseus NBRC 106054 TaxID=1220578 RepID=A0A0E9N2X1_9BACT|nr:SDR family oxidoreductase [Flavihumibacter petaseus]GAO43700.1 hypothetical protein FPE01S_02_08060 [Flavihumibacter petaseus NBRC 106054]